MFEMASREPLFCPVKTDSDCVNSPGWPSWQELCIEYGHIWAELLEFWETVAAALLGLNSSNEANAKLFPSVPIPTISNEWGKPAEVGTAWNPQVFFNNWEHPFGIELGNK